MKRPPDGMRRRDVVSRHDTCAVPVAVPEGSSAGSALQFVQPRRCNWARYEHLERIWHQRFYLLGMIASMLAVGVLGWRMSNGEHITPERWMGAVISGLLLGWMIRLALFVRLAAPKHICFSSDHIALSGLGHLKPCQILRWSLRRGLAADPKAPPCACLEIGCHWLGHEHHWTMLLDDQTDAPRLLRVLQERLPNACQSSTARKHAAIGIEAGALSQ